MVQAVGLFGGEQDAPNDGTDFIYKGPVVYQESKKMDGAIQLICVYDHKEKDRVIFESYDFESGKKMELSWDNMNFDAHFRFNAELMNPNNKDGRYHWIMERLTAVSDGKGGTKLELGEANDDEKPQVAVRVGTFKIPTGRMNYGDRARLRHEMERLPNKRKEAIQTLETNFRKQFMKELEEGKEKDAEKVRLREERIQAEREMRFEAICERRHEELQTMDTRSHKDDRRDKILNEKSNARRKKQEDEMKEVLDRHAADRAEVAAKVAAQKKKQQDDRDKTAQEAEDKRNHDEEAEVKRGENWCKREEKLEQKAIRMVADRQARIDGNARQEQARMEDKQNDIHADVTRRITLWSSQREAEETRQRDHEASMELLKFKLDAEEEKKEAKKEKKKQAKMQDDKMDAFEAKMREKVEREREFAKVDEQRTGKNQAKEKIKINLEMEKIKQHQDFNRSAAEKRESELQEMILHKEHEAMVAKQAADKERQNNNRLRRLRDFAHEKKTGERVRRMITGFKVVD